MVSSKYAHLLNNSSKIHLEQDNRICSFIKLLSQYLKLKGSETSYRKD